jgi:hypothetical protein
MLGVTFSYCYAECHYMSHCDRCHYAECRYAESYGALKNT